MAVNLSPIGGVAAQFFDNSGNILSGGKIFTYAAGTTTPQASYTSASGVTAHSNPIILDAAGRVPSGEIWLTDGLQYKFIIKTSTDVQIGSYDNIIGINSNFVNYTNSQEFQTATAGQTVFTLTTMVYQPGTKSLSVFVDGVNQYGPGSMYAYQETSDTVVTFTSGLHVGAEVKFTTSAINASSYGDAEQISYVPPFTGSVATNVEAKLAQTVSVKDFGAVGDGNADDTTAVHAAINYAKARRGSVFFPSGTYRVTSGYTQSVNQNDVHLFGEGSTREVFSGNPSKGSRILLDSTDPSSFFYLSTADHNLQVNDLTFQCDQFVQDRAFFKLGSNTSQFFTRVNFENVERPIVWPSATYFQSSAYRDVQFRNSGTFHSETLDLICTLLVFDNVNHEGSVPANTEQIACNLSGIRQIQGTNFLLEGTSPGAGWTILKLGTTYDVDWAAAPTANFDGFWIEFSGPAFGYCVEQVRGTVSINNTTSFITPTNQYRLEQKAVLELDASSFTGSEFDPATAFSLESVDCTVILKNCGARNTRQLVQQRIFYEDCFVASSNTNIGMARFSSTAPELLYSYNGVPFDPALVSSGAFGGTVFRNETDATYGRKLSVYPSANAIDAAIRATSFNSFAIGDEFFVKVRAKLPTFTGNQIQFTAVSNTGTLAAYAFDAATYSNQIVTLTIPFRLIAAATSVGFGIGTVGVTAMTDPVEIYHLEIYRGGVFTNGYRTGYPTCVTWNGTADPANGTWARGDRVFNSTPTVGQPKSWVCTVAGTPGTWVSEGNL